MRDELEEFSPIRLECRPLYLLARDKLEGLINAGHFKAGEKLPSESKLADLLGISRGTLREALRLAQRDGLIVKRHGLGNFVSRVSTIAENGLGALESVDTICRKKGWMCKSFEVSIEQRPLEPYVANALGLEEGQLATYVSRVKQVEGQRVGYFIDIVPTSLLPTEKIRAEFEGSVLDLLRSRGEVSLHHALSHILAVDADEGIADKLQVSVGRGVLLTEEILYSVDQVPIEFSYNYFLSRFFNFFVIRHLE
jgi:GntR family transcriptional regulator